MAAQSDASSSCGGGDMGDASHIRKRPLQQLTDFMDTAISKYKRTYFAEDAAETTDHLLPMKQRYNKITSIGGYDGSDPISYCYIDEFDDAPPPDAHVEISYRPAAWATEEDVDQVLPLAPRNAWKHLPAQKKEELLLILLAIAQLQKSVEFSTDTGNWYRRETPLIQEHPVASPGQLLQLTIYGDPDPSGKDFFGLLQGNKSIEDLHKELDRSGSEFSPLSPRGPLFSLREVWMIALVHQMTDGDAKIALYETCKLLSNFLTFLPESLAPTYLLPLTVRQISSSTASDSFTISANRSSSGSSSTHADGPGPQKTQSPNKNSSKGSHSKSQNSCSSSCPSSFVLPNHSRQYVGLEVTCCDKRSGQGKYILLVEVYSHGESYSAALGKFKKELIHVLQSQTEVFGLFVSARGFHMLRARRNFKNGHITVYSSYLATYSDRPEKSVQRLKVVSFQTFIMDLFTCFVYGMSHIDV